METEHQAIWVAGHEVRVRAICDFVFNLFLTSHSCFLFVFPHKLILKLPLRVPATF